MKILTFCLLFLLTLISQAQGLTVPFQNFFLIPNATLTASYTFGNFSMIFCFSNDLPNFGIITWPYQGQQNSDLLPLALTINPNFEGEFADPIGIITITNNQGILMEVSCVYGY